MADSVFEGDTGDVTTLLPELTEVRKPFGIEHEVTVSARGMISQIDIDALHDIDGVEWVAALRPKPIDKLLNGGTLQMDLFGERNVFDLAHQYFPGEQFIACRNPERAIHRAEKRKRSAR